MIYGGAFVLSLIAAATFAMFLGKLPIGTATAYGFAPASPGSRPASASTTCSSASRSVCFSSNGGYHTVQFTLYGLILGLWH